MDRKALAGKVLPVSISGLFTVIAGAVGWWVAALLFGVVTAGAIAYGWSGEIWRFFRPERRADAEGSQEIERPPSEPLAIVAESRDLPGESLGSRFEEVRPSGACLVLRNEGSEPLEDIVASVEIDGEPSPEVGAWTDERGSRFLDSPLRLPAGGTLLFVVALMYPKWGGWILVDPEKGLTHYLDPVAAVATGRFRQAPTVTVRLASGALRREETFVLTEGGEVEAQATESRS